MGELRRPLHLQVFKNNFKITIIIILMHIIL